MPEVGGKVDPHSSLGAVAEAAPEGLRVVAGSIPEVDGDGRVYNTSVIIHGGVVKAHINNGWQNTTVISTGVLASIFKQIWLLWRSVFLT